MVGNRNWCGWDFCRVRKYLPTVLPRWECSKCSEWNRFGKEGFEDRTWKKDHIRPMSCGTPSSKAFHFGGQQYRLSLTSPFLIGLLISITILSPTTEMLPMIGCKEKKRECSKPLRLVGSEIIHCVSLPYYWNYAQSKHCVSPLDV